MGQIPLETFLAYSLWFRQQFVRELDPSDIAHIERGRPGFALLTSAGEEIRASQVGIAVGVTPFSYLPHPLKHLEGHARVRFATDVTSGEGFAGQEIVVVGSGQAALESASLAVAAGANVEVVSRSKLRWFADREPDRERTAVAARLHKLAYPVTGYGPPPLNRLVTHPDLFARLPPALRTRLTSLLLKSGGSIWLKSLVEGRAKLTEGVTVERAVADDEGVEVTLNDGSVRRVDQVIAATGYRCDLARLPFLDDQIRKSIHSVDGWPLLDRHFRASPGDLLFVGYPAQNRFGPIARFVLGAEFTAGRVSEVLG
jgi:hypothetical protein